MQYCMLLIKTCLIDCYMDIDVLYMTYMFVLILYD